MLDLVRLDTTRRRIRGRTSCRGGRAVLATGPLYYLIDP